MNKKLAALLALTLLGTAHAQSGLKAGLWENRTVRMMVDGKDMTAAMRDAAELRKQQIAKLPPAQRQQAEAALARQGGDPLSRRVCISAEMAARQQPMVPRPPRAECEPPKFKRDGQRTTFELSCTQEGGKLSGKGEIVTTADLITTRLETRSSDGAGQAHTLLAETQMKYLGSDCGGIKPLEAPAQPASAAAATSRSPRKPAPAK
ncbi:MAG TPA: DUF3617 domain-containing protein [Ottowia sp.]|uniref:DUF3617 domain-containing protein n=1 Tax=Ottowia sp. TaxID=1898956 RepID=UPI0011DADAD8|nr:DUF3617 domain-containing protein [Ottowia sp.]TXI19895.1 MAG: DUF3617 domain-containing protein [Ottowia sp.]HNE60660.1 DUF3617 domain-containing protein [Ottowia sp.]HNI86032.1 DUF3617 domain-containing protein [Ottowia sp.]HNJ46520.1 DUF3617 domain-containing protein [Ottowia sp.]HNL42876.1 DUF3617 domain-containing protein [Ottowia sp.]